MRSGVVAKQRAEQLRMRSILGLVIALTISGCGSADVDAGDGTVATWALPYSSERMAGHLAGTISWDTEDGCVFLTRDGSTLPVVLASGAALSDDRAVLFLPNGDSVQAGDGVEGEGGYVYPSDIPSMWAGGDVPPEACFLPGNTSREVAAFNNAPDTPTRSGR